MAADTGEIEHPCGPACRGLCVMSGHPQGPRFTLVNCEPPPQATAPPPDPPADQIGRSGGPDE